MYHPKITVRRNIDKENRLKRELKVANLKTIVNLLNDIKEKEKELMK